MQSPHGNRSQAFRPPFMGRNGIVTSGHQLASQAGVRTMMAGGNAIDAAIATAAALGVVEPQIVRHRRRRLPAPLSTQRAARSTRSTQPGPHRRSDARTLRGDGRHPHARHAQRIACPVWSTAGCWRMSAMAHCRWGRCLPPPSSCANRAFPSAITWRLPCARSWTTWPPTPITGDLHGGRRGHAARHPAGTGGPRRAPIA